MPLRWVDKAAVGADAARLSASAGVSEASAALLCAMGLSAPDDADRYLNPALREIGDPFLVTNMGRAVERVRKAIGEGESVAVFGDYDVDGITSTVILLDALGRFGTQPRHIVPRRQGEGYGLSRNALERMLEEGRPSLLLAVDCGTNSEAEIRWLRECGTDVVIIDHHACRGTLMPEELAILVNPHVHDGEDKPWSQLCTAGLVFKFVHALLKRLREEGSDTAMQLDVREYLDLVALATVADLVPLTGENRTLARKGLERLTKPRRMGLEALYEVSGIEQGQPVTPFDISFRLSPRLNACGRMADAAMAIELLTGADWNKCRDAARKLDELNLERQTTEREIAREATEIVGRDYADCPALVLHSPEWHAGVVGIVASRMSALFHRPAIVFGAEEGGVCKGSGRSGGTLDLVEALAPCAHLLETWGGHPMAVGVSIRAENIVTFREAFAQSVEERQGNAAAERELPISAWLRPADITPTLFEEHERMEPFGQGNPQPIVAVRSARVLQAASIFGDGHCRFHIETQPGQRVACVAWRVNGRTPPPQTPLDIAVKLTWNVWKGQRTSQLQVEDWREAVR